MPEFSPFLFHQSCFTTWHEERARLIADERGTLLCSVCGCGINVPPEMVMDDGKPRHVTCVRMVPPG